MENSIGGYYGRLLRINLTSRIYTYETIPEKLIRNFIGGRGLGSKLLFDEVPAKCDALGVDNKLYFLTGPLTGINAPTTTRFTIVTKSPLTGSVGGCLSGGHFGQDLKATGNDVLVVEGIADRPCYIYVDEDQVEIRDASAIWGKNTTDTTDMIMEGLDTKPGIACIGPAGELLMNIASIMNEKNHAAGRGGMGAVMGSKLLKAVVVNGKKKIAANEDPVVQAAVKNWRLFVAEAPLTKDVLKEYGTPALVKTINNMGTFPTKNFTEGVFIDAESISGETFKELYFVKRAPCSGCPIACARLTSTPTRQGKGPEFETIWSFGAACGINDLEQIIHANYNCNESGIDTISAGSTIACAMELSEKGYLDAEAQQQIKTALGRDLKFGDAEAIVILTALIGKGQGFGVTLGLGSRRMAEKFGHPELAMHVKGLEMPAYDPRGLHGMSIALGTNNRGGCHLRSYLVGTEALATPFKVDRFSSAGKPGITKLYQDLTSTIDSMVACLFTAFALNPDLYADLVGKVMGVEMTGKDLIRTGERIWNLERLFNIREGLGKKDDYLPQRVLHQPFLAGLSKGSIIEFDELLSEYYSIRGWDDEGNPTHEKLAELGLLEEGAFLGQPS